MINRPVDSTRERSWHSARIFLVPSFADIPEPYRSRPFRVADAIADGLSHNVLASPRFWTPFSGVRVPSTVQDTLAVRCKAASLVMPRGAAFSHHTAALLCGLPIPDKTSPDRSNGERVETVGAVPAHQPIEAMVEPSAVVPQIDGIDGHSGLDPDDVIDVAGLRVVTPERTFFHLARRLSLDDLVVLGDAIVRHWCSPERLIGRAAGLTRRRGIVRAREALGMISPRVDSPPETRLRLLLIRAGLPFPAVNVDVFDDTGRWLARPDLSYPLLKIAIEYDGDHHRTDKYQWRRDRVRDESLRHAGWVVITLTADDLFRHPVSTVARVQHYYRARSSKLPSC